MKRPTLLVAVLIAIAFLHVPVSTAQPTDILPNPPEEFRNIDPEKPNSLLVGEYHPFLPNGQGTNFELLIVETGKVYFVGPIPCPTEPNTSGK